MLSVADSRRQTRDLRPSGRSRRDLLYTTRLVSIRSWRRILADTCLLLALRVSVLRRQDLLDRR